VLGDICRTNENQFSPESAKWLRDLSLKIPDDRVVKNTQHLTDNITLLTKSYRFGSESGISKLAGFVNAGDKDQAIEVLENSTYQDVSLIEIKGYIKLEKVLRQRMTTYFQNIIGSETVKKALGIFDEFRILSAHRRGPWGVEYLNQFVENILQQEGLLPKYQPWYQGKPVIINVNDYSLGLHNGDTGVCLPDEQGELKVFFHHENSVRGIIPARLPDHSTAFALTVHKSQGSEFEDLFFVLPDKPSKVLSRELIYTAITRARTAITLLGSKDILSQGIKTKLERTSGLKDHIWGI
jgi:exodeoxyribonuclease V alpha subunit